LKNRLRAAIEREENFLQICVGKLGFKQTKTDFTEGGLASQRVNIIVKSLMSQTIRMNAFTV